MTHHVYQNVPADADYFISESLKNGWVLWKRGGSSDLPSWDIIANIDKEARTLILHGIGAKDRSCFDADRNRFITGSIEQLDRFE